MLFLKKSIIRKLLIHLIFLLGLIVAIVYFLYLRNNQPIPFYVLPAALFGYLIIFVLIYFVDIVFPLKGVLYQIQALLTGKPYKRIYTTRVDEIGILAHFFNQVTKGFSEVSYDIQDRNRMISELSIAASLQRDILPLKTPNVPFLRIVAKYKPATELGGDSFNFMTVKNKTYIYVGDVTGHGVAAGLIMTMAYSLLGVFAEMFDNAYDIIVRINHYIKKHVKKSMFMTMVLLSFDHQTKKMTYVGAGHEHILVYRRDSGVCEAILSGGCALGMVADNAKLIKELEVPLNDGDFVILYSDGITEARNPAEELFGLERLKKAVAEYAAQYGAEGVNYHVAQNVMDFMKGHKQDDDMTLIVMQRDDKFTGQDIDQNSTQW